MFPSLEIWAWLKLGHTQTMGMVVPRALLVKTSRNHHCLQAKHDCITKTIIRGAITDYPGAITYIT